MGKVGDFISLPNSPNVGVVPRGKERIAGIEAEVSRQTVVAQLGAGKDIAMVTVILNLPAGSLLTNVVRTFFIKKSRENKSFSRIGGSGNKRIGIFRSIIRRVSFALQVLVFDVLARAHLLQTVALVAVGCNAISFFKHHKTVVRDCGSTFRTAHVSVGFLSVRANKHRLTGNLIHVVQLRAGLIVLCLYVCHACYEEQEQREKVTKLFH